MEQNNSTITRWRDPESKAKPLHGSSPPSSTLLTTDGAGPSGPHDRKLQRSVLVIVGAFLLITTVLFVWLHHRNRLMPSQKQRYNITELFMAPADDLCPRLSADPHRAALEQCVEALKLPSPAGPLTRVKIPSLEDTPLQSYPRLLDLFDAQGLDHLKKAFLQEKDFLVGMQVPRAYFSEDTVHGDPFTLALAQVRQARFCYLGKCPYQFDRHSYVAIGPPLYDFYNTMSRAGTAKTELIPVWMYMSDLTSTIGLNLEHGIFVARSSALRAARFIHSPIIQGLGFICTFTALGIALMSLVFAWNRKNYMDTAAFVVLASMLYLNTVIEPYLFSFGSLPLNPKVRLAIINLGEIQLLIAASFFGWSTSRPATRPFWLAYTFASVCALVVAPLLLAAIPLPFTRNSLPTVIGILQFIVPPGICLASWLCALRSSDPAMKQASHRRNEQFLFALTLGLLGAVPLLDALQHLQGLLTYPVSSLRGLMLIPIFSVLLYTAFGKRSLGRSLMTRPLSDHDPHNPAPSSWHPPTLADSLSMIDLLAHDVRKPFSMIKAGLHVLGSHPSQTPNLNHSISLLSKEVQRSLNDLDTLLHEMVRFKRFCDLSLPATRPLPSISIDQVLVDALKEVFKAESHFVYHFMFNFEGVTKIHGVHQDLVTSLANLIHMLLPFGAKNGEGTLHIDLQPTTSIPPHGSPRAQKFKQITIWVHPEKQLSKSEKNIFLMSNPLIPSSKIKLRLRNVQQDLARFGGRFFGVTPDLEQTPLPRLGWTLELPLAEEQGPFSGTFPESRREQNSSDSLPQSSWPTISTGLISGSHREQRIHPEILIIDDEVIYSEAVHKLILMNAAPHSAQSIKCFTSPDEAWNYLTSNSVSLVICDIDFHSSVLAANSEFRSGIDLSARVKERFPDTTLVLHSNRRLSHDHPEVLRSKADFFVIKPMTLRDLSQFLALRGDLPSEPSSLPPPSFPSLTESDATAISPPPPVKVPLQSHQDAATDPLAHEKGPQTSSQKLIAIVDDDIFIREAWVQKIRPYPTRSFSSVEDLLGELERDTPLSSQFELMILDQYLEDGMTGLEFAQKIRRQETPLPANIPLVLATDAYDSIEKDPKKRSFVDLVLSKDPLTYPDIIKKLESLKKS